ncbi:MAG: SLC13 family permease [Anaerolineales bacterium]|nr:SLC13 family permease [Anaerolineales bacterium]
MTVEMWIVLGILAAAILLFTTEWIRLDIVAWCVVVCLILSGTLDVSEAIAGFSNPAVLTIASLFIVGGALLQTGVAASISRRIMRVAGDNEGTLILVLMAVIAVLSSVMSDTGTVAVLLPAVMVIARSSNLSASRLLIPLSFGALLGGASTLIGTPPNLIVSEMLNEAGFEPFGFFSFTPVGLILILSGILFMFFFGRHLLPQHKDKPGVSAESPQELISRYRLPDSLYRLHIHPDSPLVGQTIQDSGLRETTGLTILEIHRKRNLTASSPLQPLLQKIQSSYSLLVPGPDSILQSEDILLVKGKEEEQAAIAEKWQLQIEPASDEDQSSLANEEIGVAELILRPRSSLIGKTLVQARFASRYKVTVLDLHRPNAREELDPKRTELRLGDTLLVQGLWRDIAAMQAERGDFIVLGEPETLESPVRKGKAPITLLILALMVVLMITQVIPVAAAAMVAGLALVLTGCLSMDEAYRSIDWKSILLVAGMLPMSTALEKVGLVQLAAETFSSSLGVYGPVAVMAGLFLLTSTFTQVLSNTATIVLIAPIALAIAESLSVQPHPMLMAVAIAASMAFASPVASPVNTLVMGAGKYRFADYARVGVPMILIALLVSMLVLPVFFPF